MKRRRRSSFLQGGLRPSCRDNLRSSVCGLSTFFLLFRKEGHLAPQRIRTSMDLQSLFIRTLHAVFDQGARRFIGRHQLMPGQRQDLLAYFQRDIDIAIRRVFPFPAPVALGGPTAGSCPISGCISNGDRVSIFIPARFVGTTLFMMWKTKKVPRLL